MSMRLSVMVVVVVVVVEMMIMEGTAERTDPITCKATTSSQHSWVTCYFGVNVHDSKHNFNLQFYYPDLHADPETFLMCNWLTGGDMKCKPMQGIDFDKIVSDQITVKGPPMTKKMTGQFVCQLVPSLDVTVKPCNITYRPEAATTPSSREVTMDLNMLEEINERTAALLTFGTVILVVLSIVTLTVLIAVIFLIIYFCKSRAAPKSGQQQGWEEGDGEKQGVREPLLSQETNPSTADETTRSTGTSRWRRLFGFLKKEPEKDQRQSIPLMNHKNTEDEGKAGKVERPNTGKQEEIEEGVEQKEEEIKEEKKDSKKIKRLKSEKKQTEKKEKEEKRKSKK